jgi:hypothetical protein
MTAMALLNFLTYTEPCACFVVLLVIFFRKQLLNYKFLSAFLLVRLLCDSICIPMMQFAGTHHAEARNLYQVYFYVYWTSQTLEACLALGVVYNIYRLAMAPLRGLQALGMLMFRWAAGISIVVAVGVSLAPHITSTKFLVAFVSQLQQTQSILTLCMLLFVTFAMRPMGLSYRSKVFGVSLGLGLLATSDLVCSAWISHSAQMRSSVNFVNGFAILAAIAIWTAYFAMPEPKRRLIVLPTTSPFLRWNQISMALGDAPGYVAVGGFPPELLAPAEVEVMRRASVKMMASPAKV